MLAIPRRGQHRATDRIAALEAERDTLLARLLQADQVIGRYATQRVNDATRIDTLTATVDALTTENEAFREACAGLTTRHLETRAELEALKARLRGGVRQSPMPGVYTLTGRRIPTAQRIVPIHTTAAA